MTAASAPVTLVWFYRDLRLDDNPALMHAAEQGVVVPVFIWAPEEEVPWAPGAAAKWWLHHALQALGAELKTLNLKLILRLGPSLPALLALCKETQATGVVWNRRYEPALVQRDTLIKARLKDAGLDVATFNGSLLYEPWEVATKAGTPFTVFTPFWKSCLVREPPAPLGRPPLMVPMASPPQGLSVHELALEPERDWKRGLQAAWQPGAETAAKLLNAFVDEAVCDYRTQRDLPAVRGTSRLSPYLHAGEISPRQIWQAIKQRSAVSACDGAATYLKELGWREFAYHLLFHFPAITTEPLRKQFVAFPWRDAPDDLNLWQRGRTGLPLIDAGMRELWTTGWMHNRVRMIVASFLTKHLRIHWLAGARWFWDTLVDADLANNTLGWQWSAGSGADAAPYFRIFNPVTQSLRFDPQARYLQQWLPELIGADCHEPWKTVITSAAYPAPMVDLAAARKAALAAYQAVKTGVLQDEE